MIMIPHTSLPFMLISMYISEMEVVPGQFDDVDAEGVSVNFEKIAFRESVEDSGASDGGFDEDYSEEDEDDDDYFDVGSNNRLREGENPNQQNAKSKLSHYQPNEKILKKFTGKIYVGQYDLEKTAGKVRDKSDRATVEQVMDPRTRMILFKLLNKGFITEIDGCISTGKEANVYHCLGSEESGSMAIKIFKTSILVFKDRDRYVSGEFRFRQGYGKKNPRKMVQTWAEKEMRNLVRIHNAGIPSPRPHLLRSHVLVMDFLGQDGWPAPRLKDANISVSKARELYRQVTKWRPTVTGSNKLTLGFIECKKNVPRVQVGPRRPVRVQHALPPGRGLHHRRQPVGGARPPSRPGVPQEGPLQRDGVLQEV